MPDKRCLSVYLFVRCAAACLISLLPIDSARADPDAEKIEFFERKIRPLFVQTCTQCHGDEVQENGLRLDSRAALLKGGQSGPALVPGDAERSLLMLAVRHRDEDLKMPPEGGRLPDHEIASLEKWINEGAAWPQSDESISAAPMDRLEELRAGHWAFRPIGRAAGRRGGTP